MKNLQFGTKNKKVRAIQKETPGPTEKTAKSKKVYQKVMGTNEYVHTRR